MHPKPHRTVVSDGVVSERTVEWDEVRSIRDSILRQTDWRFMSDQSPSNEWVVYRQTLRDLPQNFGSGDEAADNWPESPEDE